ncbi:MAG: type V CRISPR-associated protein Cas12a/Cpf1 [Candidatus ainarchaeum sp.]|nr:type V CRISPR-associated protein Cas12a/Cpf1 [Candidatus ainarchaeum sp.]
MTDNKCVWDNLVNQYSLSKTLRFELKPVGKTLDYIKEKNLILEDKQREEDFNKVKEILDDYYKDFIEIVLNQTKMDYTDLSKFREIYENLKKDKTNKDLKKEYFNIQQKLRKSISLQVKSVEGFNHLFKKELIAEELPKWLEKKDRLNKLELTSKFSKWNTYFTGFFKNRENVFSEKEIPTSIIYRIVHDNLPKYLDNLAKIEKISILSDLDLTEIEKNYSLELENNNLKEYFSLSNFNSFLNQEGIERYNLLIGGKSTANNTKIRGLNECINLYSQKLTDKITQKNIRKLKLTPLYKQILSDRDSFSDRFEQLKNNKEVIDKINLYYSDLVKEKTIENLKKLIYNLDQYDLSQIYIRNDASLTNISQERFKDYSKIKQGLQEYAIKEKKLKTTKKVEEFIKQKYFSISEIESGLKLLGEGLSVCDYFKSFKMKEKNILNNISEKFGNFSKIEYNSEDTKFDKGEDTTNTEIIKSFLDSIIDLLHFIKPISVNYKFKIADNSKENKESEAYELDYNFYNDFNEIYAKLSEIIKIYNQTRNYITKKPFVTKKFKLNFDNSTLLDGWDKNKEKDNYGVILKKGKEYYLGILTPDNKNVFDTLSITKNGDIEKMVCKLLPGPNKMLPKVFFSEKNINYYNPSDEILDIRNHSSHTKGGNPQEGFEKKDFNIMDCHKFINFLKESINMHPEWGVYNFKFKDATEYADSSEFYLDVANQGYILDFASYDFNSILDVVNSGKLYLFQIYNKDFSEYSKGHKNLHTMYWEELFSEDNLKDVVYKLNGEAEIFYREKSISKNITHPKNQELTNKNPIKNKEKSLFNYDLIKDKRYTEDKFLFHCPITLNFKQKDRPFINNEVNELIKKNKNINVLSIDRGERNLVYYTLLNQNGDILSQDSFNSVSDNIERKDRKYDYKDKLDQLEGKRDDARKNWKKIENIKELKEGYLSQVVHKIAKLSIKHNAIIVLEDLNFGFKRGRFKIEKQVYQKFEKMLIDKLNYLVFKENEKEEAGGTLKAYQLTSKFESFKKLGKQSGIIYYVPASYTSKICPKTGFINFIYPKFENIKQAQDLIKKFKYIKYHLDEDLFEFNFNFSDFRNKDDKSKLDRENWSIWSNGIKLIQFRNKDKNNQWDTKEVNVTKELKELFDNQKIDYKTTNNLKDQIININSKEFLEKLIDNLKLILQLRNSRANSDEDYILSCVKDKDFNFFDSRKAKDNEPKDADANGAYNVGLKGLIVIDRIKKLEKEKKLDLKIDKIDFLNEIIVRNK